MDLGLYLMHRASHHHAFLWRLHAIHHSPERLYWLNGERRHPLSALLLAGPGLIAVVALGASPEVISAWLTLLAIHLGFQHANVDYRVGPLRYVVGVAEIHRWHHKREYEDAQVNFGEFWMLWDHLGGTFHDRPNGVPAGDVGLKESTVPQHYRRQLGWPFRGLETTE
jgi:sterol desaturase/sphingolipid hydroxylase (fatty acid hydroxylase superfamily)